MFELLNEYPVLLAAVIFFARIADVSIGTVRTILVIRSRRYLAAFCGFFEVLIWLIAAGKVIQNIDTWYLTLSYAGGYATGNIIGIWIESRLAIGSELVRVISENLEVDLAARLRERGYSVTEIQGEGDDGRRVGVVLVVAKRRKVPELLLTIDQLDPDAFWTTSDIKSHPVLPLIPRALAASGIGSK